MIELVEKNPRAEIGLAGEKIFGVTVKDVAGRFPFVRDDALSGRIGTVEDFQPGLIRERLQFLAK